MLRTRPRHGGPPLEGGAIVLAHGRVGGFGRQTARVAIAPGYRHANRTDRRIRGAATETGGEGGHMARARAISAT